MSHQHTKETLNFNGFSGYYSSVSQGYGGLDYSDVDYMNASYWKNVQTNWCDTGYQNVIHGTGEAFTWGLNGGQSYGLLQSSDLKETFNLDSMIAASAWETNQPFTFISYTYKNHVGFVEKASDTIYLSQTAQKIDFAKLATGKPTDFKDIAAVLIVSASGSYGNTCSYGRNTYTTGNQMAFDNLKVTWNGKIPHGHGGKPVMTGLLAQLHHHGAHVAAAHLVTDIQHQGAAVHQPGAAPQHAEGSNLYHTELQGIGAGQPGDLTAQFQLPQVEHFGS
jgi:hypothetical protein